MANTKRISSLDELCNAIEARHVHIPDKDYFYKFLFEYACQVIEYHHRKPVGDCEFVEDIMLAKAFRIYDTADKMYWNRPHTRNFVLQLPKMTDIPTIIRTEYKDKGKFVIPYLKEKGKKS